MPRSVNNSDTHRCRGCVTWGWGKPMCKESIGALHRCKCAFFIGDSLRVAVRHRPNGSAGLDRPTVCHDKRKLAPTGAGDNHEIKSQSREIACDCSGARAVRIYGIGAHARLRKHPSAADHTAVVKRVLSVENALSIKSDDADCSDRSKSDRRKTDEPSGHDISVPAVQVFVGALRIVRGRLVGILLRACGRGVSEQQRNAEAEPNACKLNPTVLFHVISFIASLKLLGTCRLRRLSRNRRNEAIPRESPISPLNLPSYLSEKTVFGSGQRRDAYRFSVTIWSDRLGATPRATMPTRSASASPARFGPFAVDFRAGELLKNGRRIRLQEQPLQVLAMLLEHPGNVVTRDEFRQKLWPNDTFVDFDHGLNNAINRLRETLCDSAENPRYIETLPRRGYRFIGESHNGATVTTHMLSSASSHAAPPSCSALKADGSFEVSPSAKPWHQIKKLWLASAGMSIAAASQSFLIWCHGLADGETSNEASASSATPDGGAASELALESICVVTVAPL